jgi:hypothetical protein
MATKKKPAKTLDLDILSTHLEEMVSAPAPSLVVKESELLKAVREKYELLKSVIVDRGYTYQRVCETLVKSGLKKGAYPRALKQALIKVAEERGEVWNDGRAKDKQNGNQTEHSEEPASEKPSKGTKIHQPPLIQSNSTQAQKFVEMPKNL